MSFGFQNTLLYLPNQPRFWAYVADPIEDVTGDGTTYSIIFDTTTYLVNTSFNTSTGEWTPTFNSTWLIYGNVAMQGLTSSHTQGVAELSSSFKSFNIDVGSVGDASTYLILPFQMIVEVTGGTPYTIDLTVSNSTKVVDIPGGSDPGLCFFAGYQISRTL